jgi:hypothetical protein
MFIVLETNHVVECTSSTYNERSNVGETGVFSSKDKALHWINQRRDLVVGGEILLSHRLFPLGEEIKLTEEIVKVEVEKKKVVESKPEQKSWRESSSMI